MKTKLLLFSLLMLAMGGSLFAQRPILIVGGVVTANVTDYNDFAVTLNANVTGVTLTTTVTPATGYQITMRFVQGATGSRTVAFGGNITTSCTINATALSVTLCRWQYTATGDTWADAGGSSSSSPSSLTTFFNKYYGLAPQDYGAKGDVHVIGVCGMTASVAVMTCTNSPFAATDVGKQFEMVCPGGAATPVQGTITGFNSATSVNTSVACTATVTNQGMAYATDDTAALQAWVTAMVALAVKGVPALARGGYIPQGGYWTTKGLRFVYPSGQDTTTGECAPAPNSSGAQLRCSLWLMGAGSDNSYFYFPSNFQWQFPSTSADVCGVLINHWDFPNLSNFSIQTPLSAGSNNFNTTTNTGVIGGLCFEDSTHANMTNMYVSGFHNTATTMPGLAIVSDFESFYGYSAVEVNDINLWINPLCSSASTGALTAGTLDKMKFDTLFLENPSATGANGNMQICQQTNMKQFRMANIHFRADSGSIAPINIRNNVSISNGDAFICDQCRVTDVLGTGHLGIIIQGNGRYVFPELYYENLNTSGPSATATAFDITSANATVTIQGGAINCVSCTNAVQFGAAGSVYAMDVTLTSPTNHANFARGTGTVNAFFRTTTGWDGTGTIQSTQHISNQGAVCTVGELALSAGWQSTGSATVTAVSGTGQTCKWTITTGTTTAANPTVTDTLTNALPAATTVCELNIHGGTHTAIAGEQFDQTTLSATAPIFTANFTPTAGGTTYLVTRRCGP